MRNLLARWIWKLIEPEAQAAMTHRILLFHRALINRNQIAPISPKVCKAPVDEETGEKLLPGSLKA